MINLFAFWNVQLRDQLLLQSAGCVLLFSIEMQQKYQQKYDTLIVKIHSLHKFIYLEYFEDKGISITNCRQTQS